MKAYQPTDLGRSIVRFFQEYLPTLRGMSRHTIRSYRDGMILFLGFATTDCGRPVTLCIYGLGWKYMPGKQIPPPGAVQDLRRKAAELQPVAAAADKCPFVKRNLERLAVRFRRIAVQLAAELHTPERTRVRRPVAPAI